MSIRTIRFAALSIALAPVASLLATSAPVHAAAPAADTKAAGQFVDTLADRAFAVLRDKSMPKAQVRAKFRQMLRENFAVDEIGDKLIRRHRATITPAQLAAYRAAFPDFVVNTYADRLYDYAESDLKIVRAIPRGTRGDIDVYSRITVPGGGSPIDAVWSVKRAATGRYLIGNLTVAGVNLTLTQEADFSSYIEKNGFDALVAFMRNGNNKG